MNNNQKNLFSIGQIAESIGITRKIILNYETTGLIQPDITTQTTSPKNRFPGDVVAVSLLASINL